MDFKETVKEKTDNELLKMVYEFGQWSPDMQYAVETELIDRNILPSDISETKENLIAQEIFDLSHGKEASLAGLIIGWFMVFGLLGIIIGHNYAYAKTKSNLLKTTILNTTMVQEKMEQIYSTLQYYCHRWNLYINLRHCNFYNIKPTVKQIQQPTLHLQNTGWTMEQ